MRLSLRPSTAHDAGFVYAAVELTMKPHVEALGKRWATEKMKAKCAEDAARPAWRIVCVDGTDAGVFAVAYGDEEVRLDSLVLLPAYQRRGIGSRLLRQVLAKAATKRLPVRLGVVKGNPARTFYEDHGFVALEADDLHLTMECPREVVTTR